MDTDLIDKVMHDLNKAYNFLSYAEEELGTADYDYWAKQVEDLKLSLDRLISKFEGV